MTELLIPTSEAARRLGCKKTKLFELLKTNQLAAVRFGSRTMIPLSELEQFVASLPTRAPNETKGGA